MHILIGIIGIIFFLALAFLFSSDRKNIRWKYVGLLLVIQLIFAFVLLKTNIGITVIGGISYGFSYLLKQAAEGVNFVFGGFKLDPKTLHSSLMYCYLSCLSQRLSVFYNIQEFYRL